MKYKPFVQKTRTDPFTTPPGWWFANENPLATSETQAELRKNSPNNYSQAGFCRWMKDDETDPSKRYTTDWTFDRSKQKDVQLGEPIYIEYKFRLRAIPPTTPYSRTGLLIHPDGKKDGTLGCIGIQKWTECNEAAFVLREYSGLKVKVQTE